MAVFLMSDLDLPLRDRTYREPEGPHVVLARGRELENALEHLDARPDCRALGIIGPVTGDLGRLAWRQAELPCGAVRVARRERDRDEHHAEMHDQAAVEARVGSRGPPERDRARLTEGAPPAADAEDELLRGCLFQGGHEPLGHGDVETSGVEEVTVAKIAVHQVDWWAPDKTSRELVCGPIV